MGVIELTTGKVPISPELQRACGIPLTAIIQPFHPIPDTPLVSDAALLTQHIGRCSGCNSYINHLCSFEKYGWACSLCGQLNDYSHIQSRRYLGGQEVRNTLPELAPTTVEARIPVHENAIEEDDCASELYSIPAAPIVIALVDATGSREYLELVRTSLLAAVEGLPVDARFGLIAFGGDEILLFECSATLQPCIRSVAITPGSAASPTSVELGNALPLENLLISLDIQYGKHAITACIEALQPIERKIPKRPLGEAVQSVLRYLGSIHGALGARLSVILSGCPNYGRGTVINAPSLSVNGNAENKKTEGGGHNAEFLMDPYFPEITAWQGQPPPQISTQDTQKRKSKNKGGIDGWAAAAESRVNLQSIAAELGIKDDALNICWEDAQRFYVQAGAAAASLGVIVDVFAVSTHFVGLEAIKAVAQGSGGTVGLYSQIECSFPQDLYKRMSEPFAFGAMLRLRTSPELKVIEGSQNTTRLRSDPRYPDLFHLACCYPHDAFALEIGYSSKRGFANKTTPVLQCVFQYLVMSSGGGKNRSVLQRRTRIVTIAFPLARTALDVYSSISAQAYTFTLLNSLYAVAAEEGIDAARATLVERMVDLTTTYHEWITIGEVVADPGARRRQIHSLPIDPSFKICEAMQGIPRAAYALLRGSLFSTNDSSDQNSHPDAACALRMLYETLPPSEVSTAVYPHLSSWASPDELAFPRHSLCRAALALSRQPIYLLDAFSVILIFYSAQDHVAEGASLAQHPPPHSSRLRQHVSALVQARRITPKVMVLREGSGDSEFAKSLIEDQRDSKDGTFVEYLGHIKELVAEVIEEEQ